MGTLLRARNRLASCFLLFFFSFNTFVSPVYSFELPNLLEAFQTTYDPILIKGVSFDYNNPFHFEFIIDQGQQKFKTDAELKAEIKPLIEYFLLGLTIPDEDLWVNLSYYEKDRIIPDSLNATAIGKAFVTQDLLLKKIAATLTFPEDKEGKKFWDELYKRLYETFRSSNLPIEVLNKVWIVPDQAVVVTYKNKAFVVKASLKVMLEEDYVALQNSKDEETSTSLGRRDDRSLHSLGREDEGRKTISQEKREGINKVSVQLMKEKMLPLIEKKINTSKEFAPLRQVYNSLILATYYKNLLKESIYYVYINKNKTSSLKLSDPNLKQKVYDEYIAQYKDGIYQHVRKEYDQFANKTVKRRYVSGGVTMESLASSSIVLDATASSALVNVASSAISNPVRAGVEIVQQSSSGKTGDEGQASSSIKEAGKSRKQSLVSAIKETIKTWTLPLASYVALYTAVYLFPEIAAGLSLGYLADRDNFLLGLFGMLSVFPALNHNAVSFLAPRQATQKKIGDPLFLDNLLSRFEKLDGNTLWKKIIKQKIFSMDNNGIPLFNDEEKRNALRSIIEDSTAVKDLENFFSGDGKIFNQGHTLIALLKTAHPGQTAKDLGDLLETLKGSFSDEESNTIVMDLFEKGDVAANTEALRSLISFFNTAGFLKADIAGSYRIISFVSAASYLYGVEEMAGMITEILKQGKQQENGGVNPAAAIAIILNGMQTHNPYRTFKKILDNRAANSLISTAELLQSEVKNSVLRSIILKSLLESGEQKNLTPTDAQSFQRLVDFSPKSGEKKQNILIAVVEAILGSANMVQAVDRILQNNVWESLETLLTQVERITKDVAWARAAAIKAVVTMVVNGEQVQTIIDSFSGLIGYLQQPQIKMSGIYAVKIVEALAQSALPQGRIDKIIDSKSGEIFIELAEYLDSTERNETMANILAQLSTSADAKKAGEAFLGFARVLVESGLNKEKAIDILQELSSTPEVVQDAAGNFAGQKKLAELLSNPSILRFIKVFTNAGFTDGGLTLLLHLPDDLKKTVFTNVYSVQIDELAAIMAIDDYVNNAFQAFRRVAPAPDDAARLFKHYWDNRYVTHLRYLIARQDHAALKKEVNESNLSRELITYLFLKNNQSRIIAQSAEVIRDIENPEAKGLPARMLTLSEKTFEKMSYVTNTDIESLLQALFDDGKAVAVGQVLKNVDYRLYYSETLAKTIVLPLFFDSLLTGYRGSQVVDTIGAEFLTYALIAAFLGYASGKPDAAVHEFDEGLLELTGFNTNKTGNNERNTVAYAFHYKGNALPEYARKRTVPLNGLVSEHIDQIIQWQLNEAIAKQNIQKLFDAISKGGIKKYQVEMVIELLSEQVRILKDESGLLDGYFNAVYGSLNEQFLGKLSKEYRPGESNHKLLTNLLKEALKDSGVLPQGKTLVDYLNNDSRIREGTYLRNDVSTVEIKNGRILEVVRNNTVQRLQEALNKLRSKQMFNLVKYIDEVKGMDKDVGQLYSKSAQVSEGYTVEQHATLVLRQFEKYFAGSFTEAEKATLRLTIALHDIGKPLGAKEQHKHTISIIQRLVQEDEQRVQENKLFIDERQANLAIALINGNPIGDYLDPQIKTPLNATVETIKSMAKRANMPLSDFFKLLTVYYQSDAASYTLDAGGISDSLGYLFERGADMEGFIFDKQTQRLKFSEDNEAAFKTLEKAIQNAASSAAEQTKLPVTRVQGTSGGSASSGVGEETKEREDVRSARTKGRETSAGSPVAAEGSASSTIEEKRIEDALHNQREKVFTINPATQDVRELEAIKERAEGEVKDFVDRGLPVQLNENNLLLQIPIREALRNAFDAIISVYHPDIVRPIKSDASFQEVLRNYVGKISVKFSSGTNGSGQKEAIITITDNGFGDLSATTEEKKMSNAFIGGLGVGKGIVNSANFDDLVGGSIEKPPRETAGRGFTGREETKVAIKVNLSKLALNPASSGIGGETRGRVDDRSLHSLGRETSAGSPITNKQGGINLSGIQVESVNKEELQQLSFYKNRIEPYLNQIDLENFSGFSFQIIRIEKVSKREILS